jgi:hypothetical protein
MNRRRPDMVYEPVASYPFLPAPVCPKKRLLKVLDILQKGKSAARQR